MVLEKETALFKDSAIANDINGAQDTADEKSAVFYQPTAPPIAGRKINDVWFDTDDDNTMYKFDGDGWSLQQFGKDAIVAGSITTAVLNTQDLYTNFLVTNILNAAHAVISDLSAITANIGEITAGVLKSSNCMDGSGTYSDAGMIIDLTAGTIKMPKFAVTSSGVLYATDAILSGTITATAGEIGGFAIDSTSIHTKGVAITSNASGSVGLSSSTFTRTIGGTSRSGLKFALGGNFGVTENGDMYANSGVIGPLTIANTNIHTGTASGWGGNGIYIGLVNDPGAPYNLYIGMRDSMEGFSYIAPGVVSVRDIPNNPSEGAWLLKGEITALKAGGEARLTLDGGSSTDVRLSVNGNSGYLLMTSSNTPDYGGKIFDRAFGYSTVFYGSLASASDIRLKNDLHSLEKYEKMYMQLQPMAYRYKAGDKRIHFGYIAQDIQNALTESGYDNMDFSIVTEHEDGLLSMDYDNLQALNTYMIQKLFDQIDMLKAKIKKMEEAA